MSEIHERAEWELLMAIKHIENVAASHGADGFTDSLRDSSWRLADFIAELERKQVA